MAADTPILPQTAGALLLGLPVRRVALDAPWDWLGRGWRDLCSVPSVSLFYGAIFALAAWIIVLGLSALGIESLILVLAGGFILIGPLLAIGLYQMSRKLEAGEAVTLAGTLRTDARTIGRLGFFGTILLFVFLVWVQLAFLLLMLFLGGTTIPAASEFVPALLFTSAGKGLLLTGSLAGAMLASIVFSISAVSVPLLLVKDVDAVTAMAASVRAVSLNTGPMVLWAALIAGFMVLGLATLFVGLVVVFPLIGHATWHAFRALVEIEV
jgi:uncharacterized membrane protein